MRFQFHKNSRWFQSTRPRGRTRLLRAWRNFKNNGFQSTRPRGRTRQVDSASSCYLAGFNPRVLAGGRDSDNEDTPSSLRFQSTRPRGRTRHLPLNVWLEYWCFNPRVLAGGRDCQSVDPSALNWFQSTRPRGRTRHEGNVYVVGYGVSIHASSREDATIMRLQNIQQTGFNPRVLAGGRDAWHCKSRLCNIVSIHASSREDATRISILCNVLPCFNPRVLAGGRDLCENLKDVENRNWFQSTRPRGRTRHCATLKFDATKVSIHASSREDATIRILISQISVLFQSTRPRGRTRRQHIRPPAASRGFNPRVLAGGRDIQQMKQLLLSRVSIHASSREDATFHVASLRPSSEFQSTRPRGRTRLFAVFGVCADHSFNPRVLAGGRDARNEQRIKSFMFQSTRPRGRTRQAATPEKPPASVSIHASSREDATIYPGLSIREYGFNPRVLAGGRDKLDSYFQGERSVSIHASSREDATSTVRFCARRYKFQSTRPRGRTRLDFHTDFIGFECFNPRVLAGGRDFLLLLLLSLLKFQSTRPRGRTRLSVMMSLVRLQVSIHASSREDATLFESPVHRRMFVSIHASSREDATFRRCKPTNPRCVSIHASSREDATVYQIRLRP